MSMPNAPPGRSAVARPAPGAGALTILWVCGSRIVGGAERATLQVARCLHERGHRLAVLHPLGSALEPVLAAAELPGRAVRLGGALSGHGYRSIRAALAADSPDIVLVTTIDQWIPTCLASRRWTGGVVLVRHMALPVSRPVVWAAERGAGAIVAVSGAVRDSLMRSGTRADRVRVISNPTRFPVRAAVPTPAERARAREHLGLPVDGRWVGFFGGSNTAKGVTDILAAVAQLDDVRLLICGRARGRRDRAAAAVAVRELGLSDRCRDLGEIDAVDVALTAVDVAAVPTRRALGEAMPLTVIEAMACGTPVVASAVGGIPEALGDDGTSGRLIEPDNPEALARALADVLAFPHRAREIAARALQRARERFDPARIAGEYEALFRETRAAAVGSRALTPTGADP